MESHFVPAGPIYLQILGHNCDSFVTYILRINKRSSIHRLQFGFISVFIAPIGFSCFTTLNVIYLRRYVGDVVELKYCSKWAANESDLFRS